MQFINFVKKVNTYNIIYNHIVFYKFSVKLWKIYVFLEYLFKLVSNALLESAIFHSEMVSSMLF